MSEGIEYAAREVPRDESGRLDLLATLPPLWEYLLFGAALYRSRAPLEARWRDHLLGYTPKVGSVVEPENIPSVMSERLSYVIAIVTKLERILDPIAQERAFGKPGESGNPELIEHIATRLIELYSLLLEWAEETRALRVPDWAERLRESLVSFVKQPLQQTHDFVDQYIERLEEAIFKLASGESSREEITMTLKFTLDDGLLREYNEELRRIKRRL